jgi:8-oxo-dGTP pyrophosphatase MutT (NUDIX family)
MEQVRVRIGDDELLGSWHPPHRPPHGPRHGAEGLCITDSGRVIVVSRHGPCWEFPAG